MGEDGTRVNNENNEFRLKTRERVRLLDFYVESLNKGIEFDGTYWHGEVGRGNRTRDEDRDTEIQDCGIELYHVKESDYKANKELEVLKCLEFLNGGREDNPYQGVG